MSGHLSSGHEGNEQGVRQLPRHAGHVTIRHKGSRADWDSAHNDTAVM